MVFQTWDTRWADVNSVRMSVCRSMFSNNSLMRNISCGRVTPCADILEDDWKDLCWT